MKLASYLANGKPCFGVVVGDGVVTMNERLGGRFATLRDAIAGGAIDMKPMITHRFDLDHGVEAFELLRNRKGVKALIMPQA